MGIIYVVKTATASLKVAVGPLFFKYGLSVERLFGQGYDGANNVKGELYCLKMLTVKENEYAFYVHCFLRELYWHFL